MNPSREYASIVHWAAREIGAALEDKIREVLEKRKEEIKESILCEGVGDGSYPDIWLVTNLRPIQLGDEGRIGIAYDDEICAEFAAEKDLEKIVIQYVPVGKPPGSKHTKEGE